MWEANIEMPAHVPNHAGDWARPASCLNRLYNDHSRQGRTFNRSGYDFCPHDSGTPGCLKCNIFISDIALRSGFRCCIHAVGTDKWHYIAAGTYADRTNAAGHATDRIPLQGTVQGTATTWGFKFEQWLRAILAADRQARVNELMTSEGRCLILAGSRASGHSGHIIIVESVGAQIDLVASAGHGLSAITVTTREARTVEGGESRTATFALSGVGGAADSLSNFVRLHLFELHPGQDPDTLVGLRNCNVQV
jgi:hypothetical protein